jgi:type I restriction enzyme R subunit
MKELDLQGDYVMNFICRNDKGLQYREVKNTQVNQDLFIPSDLEEFISTASPKEWKRLLKKYDTPRDLINAIIAELKERLMEATNVAIFINNNRTVTFEGESLRLFFVSGTELKGDEEFEKNIFSAVEEMPYLYKVEKQTQFSIRPDISFFINGIFFGYAELKSNFNNQSAKVNGRKKVVYDYMEAVRAYTKLADRNDTRQTLRRQMLRVFEKAIHLTSTDINETYIIRNIGNHFDELKKGFQDGTLLMSRYEADILKTFKPYPVNNLEADARTRFEGVMRSLYAKEEIQKEILYYNFLQYEYIRKNKKLERKTKTGRLISPRPKQKFGTDKILKRIDEFLEHEKEPDYFITKLRKELERMGAGSEFIEKVVAERDAYYNNKNVYSLLMQYAAGFGKSNIIGWTALQLKDMRRNNQWVFDKILIVVDRLQLRAQLDETMHNMNISSGMFVEATSKDKLIKALAGNTRIIVVNIHKFNELQEALASKEINFNSMRVAFLIDEIHRSNTGDGHDEMMSVFEELQDVFDKEAEEGRKPKHKNLIIGFTATPSEKVLARFGEYYSGSNINQLWKPFDAYTMREAIDDGYILDPTKHIIPVPAKMYYEIPDLNLRYVSGDDEEIRYRLRKEKIYGNPDRIHAISRFVVNRLLSLVYGKIRGTGKAMLAVSSIPVAIEYCQTIRKMMEDKLATGKYENYRNAPISIVYSDNQIYQSSKSLNNNVNEEDVIKNFKLAKNGLMIVVDKLQTGFDEPRLHSLFLDKEIREINAIQTISRVNRTCKYKTECHIIDLSHNNVNVKNIQEAFVKFSNLVISDFDPLAHRRQLEKDNKQLNAHLLFSRWFSQYSEYLSSNQSNVDFILEMENDIRRWIKEAIERKFQEDRQSEEGDLSENTRNVDNDALKLKKQINEYLSLLSLLNGIIDIEPKLTESYFLDFWQRYLYIYNLLNSADPNPEMDILVSYDNELGLILKPIEEEEENTGGGSSGKSGKGKKYQYNILAIIESLNQHEAEKEKIILEWKEKIDTLFKFLNQTGDLTAKMNSSELFDREQLHAEFKKAVKKYIRVHKLDLIEKSFYEDNMEQLFEDFDNFLHPQTVVIKMEDYTIREKDYGTVAEGDVLSENN